MDAAEIVSSIGSPVDICPEIILVTRRFSGYRSIVPCYYYTILYYIGYQYSYCWRVKPISFFAITVTTILLYISNAVYTLYLPTTKICKVRGTQKDFTYNNNNNNNVYYTIIHYIAPAGCQQLCVLLCAYPAIGSHYTHIYSVYEVVRRGRKDSEFYYTARRIPKSKSPSIIKTNL